MAKVLLLDHLEGCSPLERCASCLMREYLVKKLSESDFRKMVARLTIAANRLPTKPRPISSEVYLDELRIALREVGYVFVSGNKTIRRKPAKPPPG